MWISTYDRAFSRLASEDEIKNSLHEANINNGSPKYGGIPLFSVSDSVYIDPTDTHSLIIGATGSKKTRLIAMPTLRLYAEAGESFVATDPKAELYERTQALLKERGYRIFLLNLRDPLKSNGWNPLLVPYRMYHNGQQDRALELIIDMANCIMNDSHTHDPYWQNSGADLLAGLILVLFECGEEEQMHFKSLRAIRTEAFRMVKNSDVPFIREHFIDYLNASVFVCSLLSGTADVTESTRSCILSVFDQAMRPFFSQSDLIDMLSGSDFEMGSIGKEKTAVFLIIPDENTLYHRLVSVFVKQCYTELILDAQKQKSKKLPRRVNFLLDEFSALPQISDFPAMITASRSRNIRFNLIVQSFNQLNEKYGNHAETIKGNCENWVYLYSRELGILNEIIELCGKKGNEEQLITVTMLQTLDKDKGEAVILHKRLHPFVASLPDIERYHSISNEERDICYPQNTRKAQSVFNFQKFCCDNNQFFISKLFLGKTLDEIRNISSEEERSYYMIDDNENIEPIFTTTLNKQDNG